MHAPGASLESMCCLFIIIWLEKCKTPFISFSLPALFPTSCILYSVQFNSVALVTPGKSIAVPSKHSKLLLAQFPEVNMGQYCLTNLILPSKTSFNIFLIVLYPSFLLTAVLLVSLAETYRKLWNRKKKPNFLRSSSHHRNRRSFYKFRKNSP